jgi:hypothetical protein
MRANPTTAQSIAGMARSYPDASASTPTQTPP